METVEAQKSVPLSEVKIVFSAFRLRIIRSIKALHFINIQFSTDLVKLLDRNGTK